jgi:hypothetical protein
LRRRFVKLVRNSKSPVAEAAVQQIAHPDDHFQDRRLWRAGCYFVILFSSNRKREQIV